MSKYDGKKETIHDAIFLAINNIFIADGNSNKVHHEELGGVMEHLQEAIDLLNKIEIK